MKTTTASLIALLVPAALCAQVSGQASASATVEFRAPADFSASGAAKLNAMYAEAKEHHVPRQPIANRVAEGRAKGASEAKVIVSAGHVKANLEAAHDAMVAGGRTQPSDAECERGAAAIERGATSAQIEATARGSVSDNSLVVAFDHLNATAGAAAGTAAGSATAGATATGSAAVATKPAGATLTTTVGGVVHKP